MTFRERLLSRDPLLLDGGMGSALIARGLVLGAPPELWNVERADDIRDVHRGFVDAGSDAVQTNTFGGNSVRLGAHGLASRCEELNRAAVQLAREAGPAFVIGDIGPTGEYLPPVGSGRIDVWKDAFTRQASALADAGVDGFHVETMSDAREARVALEAIRSVAPSAPVMVSMTFERKKRGFFTVMGDPLVATLASLHDSGADAVGTNCSLMSGEMRSLFEEVTRELSIPLVAQPNAGSPESGPDGTVRYRQAPEEFAADLAALARMGVSILGGCCGTDDRFIAALKDRVRSVA